MTHDGKITAQVLIESIRLLKCPFCEYSTSTFSSLVTHIRSCHPLASCPLCGYSGKNVLMHLAKKNDLAHNILWAIYTSPGNHGRSHELRSIRSLLIIN